MAYQTYTIPLEKGSLSYAGFTGVLVAAILETVPGITLNTVNTDTSSTYDATLNVSGLTNVKLRIHNSNGTLIVRAGVGFTASADYNSVSVTIPNSGFKIKFTLSDGLWFCRMQGSSVGETECFGTLTSLLDNSKIEVFFSSASNAKAALGTTPVSMSFGSLTIGEAQTSTLPDFTLCMLEGCIYASRSEFNKAPYGINGHSVYRYYSATPVPRSTIISNGTDYFYVTTDGNSTSGYVFRLT